MEKFKTAYRKISSWLHRDDLDLSKKWWHRLLKILFIISIIVLTLYIIVYMTNYYPQIVNRWNFVDSIPSRLSGSGYTDKILSIKHLYGNEEIITEYKYSQIIDYSPNLKNKDLLLPFSPIFVDSAESFCSHTLDRQIKKIAVENNIRLFSTTNPSLSSLSSDIDAFASYLKNSWIKCVMIDSYSLTNDDDSVSKKIFLRPIDVYEYYIYKYENNLAGFVFAIFLSLLGLFIYTLVVLFIYNKVILYIIYGSKK